MDLLLNESYNVHFEVLYKMFSEFSLIGEMNLDVMDYIQGIFSFLIISLGGVFIGLLFAIFACISTKCQ